MKGASDWNALCRLADIKGTQANPVTQIRGRVPPETAFDNGGATAQAFHDDEFCGVVLSDGTRYSLND